MSREFWTPKPGDTIRFLDPPPQPKGNPWGDLQEAMQRPAPLSPHPHPCINLPACIFCEAEQQAMAAEAIRRTRLL